MTGDCRCRMLIAIQLIKRLSAKEEQKQRKEASQTIDEQNNYKYLKNTHSMISDNLIKRLFAINYALNGKRLHLISGVAAPLGRQDLAIRAAAQLLRLRSWG